MSKDDNSKDDNSKDDNNYGNIIVAVVAVAAIIGLVSSFTGTGLAGLFHMTGDPGYEVLAGYSGVSGIQTSPSVIALGNDLGESCLSWTVDQHQCCSMSCGDSVDSGNDYNECNRACQNTVNAYYGY